MDIFHDVPLESDIQTNREYARSHEVVTLSARVGVLRVHTSQVSQREEVFASHCQADAFEVELVHNALRQLIGQVDVLHNEVRSIG